MISALINISEDRPIEIIQFEVTVLCEDILLVHYTSHHKENNSYVLRTSVWKFEDSNRKLYFHHGHKASKRLISRLPTLLEHNFS